MPAWAVVGGIAAEEVGLAASALTVPDTVLGLLTGERLNGDTTRAAKYPKRARTKRPQPSGGDRPIMSGGACASGQVQTW